MNKYNLGDKLRVLNAEFGAYGCNGEVGVVTDEEATEGRNNPYKKDDFNIKIRNRVWRVSGSGSYELIMQSSPISVNRATPNTYTHYYEHLPRVTNCVVRDKQNSIIDNQTVIHGTSKYKVIYSNLTTIVILEDGSKGVSKCSPEDTYDKQKGYAIAFKRAKIKQLNKQLKNLTK